MPLLKRHGWSVTVERGVTQQPIQYLFFALKLTVRAKSHYLNTALQSDSVQSSGKHPDRNNPCHWNFTRLMLIEAAPYIFTSD